MTRIKDVIYILKNSRFWIGVGVLVIILLAIIGSYNFVYGSNPDTYVAETYEKHRVKSNSRNALLEKKREIANQMRNMNSIYEKYMLDEHYETLECIKEELHVANTVEDLKQIEQELSDLEQKLIKRVQEVTEAQQKEREAQQKEQEAQQNKPSVSVPQGNGILTPSAGRVWFNGHQETYYNLDMTGVVSNAHALGITGDYWVNENGCKMLGSYIMVASSDYTKGTVISTSLGAGIVVDYCPTSGVVDIATVW